VLSIEASGLSAIAIGDARAPKPGELVFAHGHPWGVTGAVTSGVVIGVDRDWPGMAGGSDGREWLVVNMRLRPGNSGGPIVDVAGRVVGISTIMAGPRLGMAVPAHVADALVTAAVATATARGGNRSLFVGD
jgi:serine protease Do